MTYIGLLVWGELCRNFEVDWRVPEVEEFAESVVKPIELSTHEAERNKVAQFADFWSLWKVKNTVILKDRNEIRGEGVEWSSDIVSVVERDVRGDYVTTSILAEYNRRADSTDSKFKGLKELATGACDAYGIPYYRVLDATLRVKARKFGQCT